MGINLATTTSLATVADNVTIHAGGRFTLATSADTDAQAAADGSAVQPPSDSSGSGSSGASSDGSGGGVSIGAAVAINDAQIHNQAILPTNAVVTATNGATIAAVMGSTHEVGASAKSGAGGGIGSTSTGGGSIGRGGGSFVPGMVKSTSVRCPARTATWRVDSLGCPPSFQLALRT